MGATPATRPLEGDPTRPPAPGLVLGRYRVTGAIGAGGHGSVWRAFDEKLERDVALKALPRSAGLDTRRADREARAAARLNHPGIVGLYEIGEDDRAVYLVSELVDGSTLAELERAGALSDRDVAEVGLAVGDALAHAHARGVIHRDVKPQNVLVADEPAAGAGFAKLTDFGIARLAGEDPLTATGGVVGTVAYMSPEQAAGADATESSDVYALALTLHEALSGLAPAGPTRRPRPLAAARRDLPPELTATIDRCLDPRPAQRPSLRELAAALRASVDRLADVDGRVVPGPLDRLGATLRRRTAQPPSLPPVDPVAAAAFDPDAPPRRRRGRSLFARALAAAVTAATALTVTTALAPAPPFSPAAAALTVVALCLLLPRVGWLLTALALCAWLAAAGRTGAALIVAVAAASTPALLPRAALLWPAAALAPALGAIGLAPAFPALAGAARTAWQRAGVGAAGLVWLLAAEALADVRLLSGPVSEAAQPAWLDSSISAAADVIWPTLVSGLPLFALAWAALALLAGWAGARTSPLMRAGATALWAVVGAAGGAALADALALASPRGTVGGALAGAVLLVIWGQLRAHDDRLRSPPVP